MEKNTNQIISHIERFCIYLTIRELKRLHLSRSAQRELATMNKIANKQTLTF